jgi:tyrosine decarboxylase/aspartate 1-decarboxylase
MREQGISRRRIRSELKTLLAGDYTFLNGRIVGSMCTAPDSFAEEIFKKSLEKNVGDPGLFPRTIALEAEVIQEIGALLSLPQAHGYIITGGTEANILALWAAKELARNKGREVLVSEAAHFSFDKAARLLDLDLVKIPLTANHILDVAAMEKRISAKTIAFVGIAGSTALGLVDPIEELSALALQHGLYLHVDAAFGGFVIPFLKELGRPVNSFDFALAGVKSITIDPHKMGMSVIPSGGILFRDKEVFEKVKVPVPYLAGGETALPTIVGTRSGASVLATWAIIRLLGRAGYRATVEHCMELTDYLAAEIKKIPGLTLVAQPVLNIIGLASPRLASEELARALRERGWAVSQFSRHLRIVLMPHLELKHIKLFVKDCKDIMGE